jgi:hypothetical protein
MEQRRKISHMDWKAIHITEITLYLSKAHNCKSPGNDQIQNTDLNLSQPHIGILQKKKKPHCNNTETGEGT